MKKPFVALDLRQKFADRWEAQLGHFYCQFEQGHLHPAIICADSLELVWRDVLGDLFHNGPCSAPPMRHRLKFLSDNVAQVLHRWNLNQIQLRLVNYKPSVLEVLQAQSTGERIVSFLISKEQILNFEEDRRDFISFLIHDLVHASHFFTLDEAEFTRQVLFSGWMLDLEKKGVLKQLKDFNPSLEPKIDYLVSDMNTHSLHLFKTLKSLVDQMNSKFHQDLLSEHLPSQLRPLWPQVNTVQETDQFAQTFLDQFLRCQAPLKVPDTAGS